jgi:tetratricopeptide (TPR) repeat protein
MALHAFVAMPFGQKENIDFNKVYSEYIKPALTSAGFEVFRADEEQQAGNIRTDMFQELLLADLVVVDLSIDNPNVWYELGVRHGIRSRGVIQIQCKRDYLPVDVYVDRTLRYHIKDSAPDPTTLEDDRKALSAFATETMQSWQGRKISPVYHLLRYLQELDWKSLRVEEAKEFWEAYDEWAQRIDVARRRNLPGDIPVFTKEAPSRLLQPEARRKAGKALLSLGQFSYALHQYQEALAIDPTDLESSRQKGLLLGRLKKYDEAKEWLTKVVEKNPQDAESWALLGRIEKDIWTMRWRDSGKTPERMREDALAEENQLHEAIDAYVNGFRKDPKNYYAGINAVTLLTLKQTLRNEEKTPEQRALEGGVRWAVQSALAETPRDYWARVTLGDLDVLSAKKMQVERQYRSAIAVAEGDWFALDSSRQQLLLLRDLGFRPAEVGAALKIFDRELEKVTTRQARWQPRQVFLFSGHMIDAPNRPTPRFPADKESLATWAITAKLEELGAGPEDLALCGGACGGDLLFAEACLTRGVRLQIHLPFDEPEFLQRSVNYAGDGWRERFYAVKKNDKTRLLVMPDELGPLPKGCQRIRAQQPVATLHRTLVGAGKASLLVSVGP